MLHTNLLVLMFNALFYLNCGVLFTENMTFRIMWEYPLIWRSSLVTGIQSRGVAVHLPLFDLEMTS